MNKSMNSRRAFLRRAISGMGMLGLGKLGMMNALAQTPTNYKALVCVFLFGGNDGFNTVIPMDAAPLNAYKVARGGLALPTQNTQVLPVSTSAGAQYGLNSGYLKLHPLWSQKKLAAIANMGLIMQPTTRAQYLANSAPLPSNLFSHSDQTVQMQSSPTGGLGWGGRLGDAVQSMNGSANFPTAISMSGPTLFTPGNLIQNASLSPGFDLTLNGMNFWPQSAADVKKAAMQELLAFDSGMAMVQQSNKVMTDAIALNGMLKAAGTTGGLTTVFPGTQLGVQLREVAKIIKLRTSTGMMRQVFFCSIGGFDTHGSQDWAQWDLLTNVGDALRAFYDSTVEMGIADQVTSFTASEFGRTLQPNGVGTDHGWGSHHIMLGGAVKGGEMYGTFPNYALGGPDDSGSRGAMIPTTSVDQFGATLAKWFGVPQGSMSAVFPNIGNFGTQDIGFLA